MDPCTPIRLRLVRIVSFFRMIKVKRSVGQTLIQHGRVSCAILSFVYLSLPLFLGSSVVGQTAQPVTINFDSLGTNTVVTNQYSQVKFSATGFGAGSGGAFGSDLRTQNNSGLGSSPSNGI